MSQYTNVTPQYPTGPNDHLPLTPERRGGRRRISRKAIATIGTLLVGGGFAAGYATPHSGGQEAKVTSNPAAAAKAPQHPTRPTVTHEKGTSGAKPSTVYAKAHTQVPVPVSSEWKMAAAAVQNANDPGYENFPQDDRIVNGLQNKKVRAIAQRAVQTAEAADLDLNALEAPMDAPSPTLSEVTLQPLREQTVAAMNEALADRAALDYTNGRSSEAIILQKEITDPKLVSQVLKVRDQEATGDINGAQDAWDNLLDAAQSDLNNLDTAATNQLAEVNRQANASHK